MSTIKPSSKHSTLSSKNSGSSGNSKISQKEREFQISPLYINNITNNKKAVQFIRNVTSLAFGICAGILGLESQYGFIFYFVSTTFVSALIHLILTASDPSEYFVNPRSDVWFSDVFDGLSSYVLMWTLFYGLVDA